MSIAPPEIPLPVVLGPTASGKSELAIRIALTMGGEIVNCDSLQLYRGMDIGTAKVPEAARLGIPHHLIGLIEPTQLFTAAPNLAGPRAGFSCIADCGLPPLHDSRG